MNRLTFLLILFGLTFIPLKANDEVSGIIRAKWDAFETAWEAEDASKCALLFTTDGVNIPPQYSISIGRAKIEQLYGRLFKGNLSSEYTHVIDQLDVVGEDQLVEVGHFSVDWVRNDSSTWTFEARSLATWLKDSDGEWRIDKFVYNNPVSQSDLAEYETKWRTAEKEQRILEQHIQISQGATFRNYLLLLAGGLIALLLALYSRFRLNQLKSAKELERLKQEKQITAMRSMVEGQEKERTRIARSLHDGVGSSLIAIRQRIGALNGDNQELESMIVNTCDDVRRISHNMMPSSIAAIGLRESLIELFEENDSVRLKINYHIPHSIDDLTETQQINVYRIIQEAVSNILKHAQASEVQFQSGSNDGTFSFSIVDNGVGMSHLSDQQGLGIQNIKARVDYLNGDLSIASSEPSGTHMMIRFPLSS